MQFPPDSLSTAAATAKHNLRFLLSSLHFSLTASALRIVRYCHKINQTISLYEKYGEIFLCPGRKIAAHAARQTHII